jgi:hypothetical protein
VTIIHRRADGVVECRRCESCEFEREMMLERQRESTAGVEAEGNIEDQQHEHKLLNCDPEGRWQCLRAKLLTRIGNRGSNNGSLALARRLRRQ